MLGHSGTPSEAATAPEVSSKSASQAARHQWLCPVLGQTGRGTVAGLPPRLFGRLVAQRGGANTTVVRIHPLAGPVVRRSTAAPSSLLARYLRTSYRFSADMLTQPEEGPNFATCSWKVVESTATREP